MRLLLLSLFFMPTVYAACDCGSQNALNPCTGNQIDVAITGDGRTIDVSWSFASGGSAAYCGQFANGDYWIAPAAGQTAVTLTAVSTTGSGPVSLDKNPQLESIGLLSADPDEDYGNYVAAENLTGSLPMDFSDGSLVAAVQRDEVQHGGCGTRAILGNCAEAYQVVTVLSQVPSNAGASLLRPSIDESDKVLLSLDDFAWSRLPSLDFLSPLSATALENIRQRWSHSSELFSIRGENGTTYSEGGRAFRANLLVDDYAAGVARAFVSDAVALMAAGNPPAATRKAWAALLTYGQDLYYGVYDSTTRKRGWGSGAGQHLGKFPPAVLFAALYGDAYYRDVLRQTSLTLLGHSEGALRGVGPQELEQINIGINGPIWGDFPDQMGRYEVGRYWGALLSSQCYDGALGECVVNSGKKTTRDPHNLIDGPPRTPGSAYMATSAGPIRGFAALAHLIPEVCETMNYPPLIEYTDRIENGGLLTHHDMCAPPDNREVFGVEGGCDAYRARNCQYYGLSNTGVATWGPTSFDGQPGCVPNNSGGNTGQNGRFPQLHGNPINIGYRSVIIENHWQTIRSLPQACNLNDLIFTSGFE